MKTITLKNEFEVKSLLLSIASNVIEWKRNEKNNTIDEIIKDLVTLAIDIENQTNVKTFEKNSIASVFPLELI
jgi:hypothetical protein